MIIVDGPHLSSVIVLDNEMQRKQRPEFDSMRIEKVSESVYGGHLFVINEKDDLLAMNLKYLCEGFAPYCVMNLGLKMGGSIL